jgi:hypothetical protein
MDGGPIGRFYNNFFKLTPKTCENNAKHVIRYLMFKVSLRYDLPPCPCFILCHLMNKILLKSFLHILCLCSISYVMQGWI